MASKIQAASTLEQADNQQRSSVIIRAYNTLCCAKRRRTRRWLTLDRLLLDAFGSISPAYLF